MRQLLPTPAGNQVVDVEVETAYAGPLGSRGDRPWVGLCMVASIDGSIAVGGTSGALSSATDAAVLNRLRWLADVILVGAGTVRDEGYGPPRRAGQRLGVVTNTGRLDFATELFASGAAFVITSETADFDVPASIDVVRVGHEEVDVAEVIGRLPSVVDRCDVVQAEGGAALNGALLDADVVDEINLTMSPAVFGGDGPRLTAGAPPITRRFTAAQIAIDDESFVYTRWLRNHG